EGVDVRHPAGGENKDDGPGFAATALGLAGKGPQLLQVAQAESEQADGPGLNGGSAAEERVSRSVGTTAGGVPSACLCLAPRTRRCVQPSGSSILVSLDQADVGQPDVAGETAVDVQGPSPLRWLPQLPDHGIPGFP